MNIEKTNFNKNDKNILVKTSQRNYNIIITDKFSNIDLKKIISNNRVFIVTNETVAPLYLEKWLSLLKINNILSDYIILKDGEKYKSFESLNKIFTKMLEQNYSRNSTLIALGGGVIGDLTGFAASCYQRGIDFLQIPTTLLADVDSSVGGKTAINHNLGKNMIGAFYQPIAVLIETSSLNTLNDREYKAGLSEVIKYGCIMDKDFFRFLELNKELIKKRDLNILSEIIFKSCNCKAKIVNLDEKEQNIRAILNFGHTFGHSIEYCQNYEGLKHGEAVAFGICVASYISYILKYISFKDYERIINLLKFFELDFKIPKGVSISKIWEGMKRDKKNNQGTIKFILLKEFGQAFLTSNVNENIINNALKKFS